MALSTDWINHIEAWQRSGLTQSAYCRGRGLNYHTFSARLSDYRKARKSSLPTLIPVQLPASAMGAIVLKRDKVYQLELPTSIPASWLAELLRCLD
jgi:hypothetical protein